VIHPIVICNPQVLPFALRGAGKVGWKRFSAPLADPYAEPSNDPTVAASVDLLLRATCAKLLQPTGSDSSDANAPNPDVTTSTGSLSPGQVGAVRASFGYLMARVGVPRDMSYPAARQFRAHLNWATEHHLP